MSARQFDIHAADRDVTARIERAALTVIVLGLHAYRAVVEARGWVADMRARRTK